MKKNITNIRNFRTLNKKNKIANTQIVNENDIEDYLTRFNLNKNIRNYKRAKRVLRKQIKDKESKIGKEISGSVSAQNWAIVYGKQRLGGVYSFIHTQGSGNQNLQLVLTITGHEINSLNKIFFDGEEVIFGGGFPSNATAPTKYVNKVYAQVNLGSDSQTALSQLVADSPTFWTSDHRQRGRSHVYLKLSYDSNTYSSGLPDIVFEIEGKKLYDPRTTLTTYSTNSALVLLDYLINSSYGLNINLSEIDLTLVETAADICDETVTIISGGFENRYTCNTTFYSNETPKKIIESILTSMSGDLVYENGKWRMYAGSYRAPTLSLTENDILGEVSLQTKFSRRDQFNSIRGTYISSENFYEETDFPIVKNSFYKQQDNNEEVIEDIILPCTITGSMAQRLAKIELEDIRQGIVLEVTCKLRAYQLSVGDSVYFSFSQLGFTNKIFKVIESELITEEEDTGFIIAVRLVLKEHASTIYSENYGEETRVDLAPNTTLPNPFSVETISNLALSSGTSDLYLRSDGTVFTRLKVSWTALTDFFVTSGGLVEIQYKKSSLSDWQQSTSVSGNLSTSYILDVEDNIYYDVRARAVSSLGISGDYTTVTNHLVIGKTEKPNSVSGLNATISDYGVILNWLQNTDLDIFSYLIKIGSVDSSWDSLPIIADINTTNYNLGLLSDGTYKVQIKAKDTTGNESLLETSINVVIQKPQITTITYSIESEDIKLNWTTPISSFAIKEYFIYKGNDFNTATFISKINGNSLKTKIDFSGTNKYWVLAVDINSNIGLQNYVDVNILVPSEVENQSIDIVINNILISWEEPTTHTLPIKYYKIYKGQNFSTATEIGNVDVTFFSYFEIVSGEFTYWITSVDSANNEGSPVGLNAIVSQPEGFINISDNAFDLSTGTYVNTLFIDNSLISPVNITESFQDHFINNSWTTPQDQIDDGYDYYIQPTPDFGYYSQVLDLGVVISNSLIKINFTEETYDGTLDVITKISVSTDNITYISEVESNQLYATNFRYIRVRLEFGIVPNTTGQSLGLLLALTGA